MARGGVGRRDDAKEYGVADGIDEHGDGVRDDERCGVGCKGG